MFPDGKRFRPSPVFDESSYPVPKSLKRSLELISQSFSVNCMRNFQIMDTSENQRLYGFITTYEADNFCWIQPTRTLERYIKDEYHTYICRVNSDARQKKLDMLSETQPALGRDVLAQYEADNMWYRAMIVGEPIDGAWLVVFIDYGNHQRCTISKMANIITEKYCNHYYPPMQAVCCRLYNVVPRLPQHRNDIDIALEKFYAENSATFLELVVRNIRRDFVVDCDVFICKSGVRNERRFFRKHIAQKLVDENLATFADPKAAYAIMPSCGLNSAEVITLDDSDEEEESLKRKNNLKKEVKAELEKQATKKETGIDNKHNFSKLDIKVKLEQSTETTAEDSKPTFSGFKPSSTKRDFEGEPKYVNKPVFVNGVAFRPFG